LIVLNNCDPKSAGARAEAIRKAMNNRPFQLTVTMSFGLLLSKDWVSRSVEELLFEVDAALYAAKAAGPDCVRLAEPSAGAAASADETVPKLR
jgi:GGDEF domain-containing protein